MVLMAWYLSSLALCSNHECTLPQIGTYPDMTIPVSVSIYMQSLDQCACINSAGKMSSWQNVLAWKMLHGNNHPANSK